VKDGVADEGKIHHNFIYLMWILMTANDPGTKKAYMAMYNLMPKTKTLLLTMAEHDPGLTIMSIDVKSTLRIKQENFPNTEAKFKQFFTCEWEPVKPKQKEHIQLSCMVNGNCTLNSLKHTDKPSCLIQWLTKEKVFLESDSLSMGKMKAIGYLTRIHPRIASWAHAKEKLFDILNTTFIDYTDAQKLDSSLKDSNTTMQDSDEQPMVHCPAFEIFQTTIGIGNKPCIEMDVIGIKCQSGQAALLCEFLIQSKDTTKTQGNGQFILAVLANIIGKETMKQIICKNNQYLKSITTTIPINGISPITLKTEIIIYEEAAEADQIKMTVYNYIMSADWCLGIEPTDCKGRYLLTTMLQELSEAHEWLDDNLKELLSEYIPQFQTFTPIEGYEYPKRGDKPRFSNQLGTYAYQLQTLHPSTNPQDSNHTDQWNRSPLHKHCPTKTQPFTFDTNKYPALLQNKAKWTQTGDIKTPDKAPQTQTVQASSTVNPNVINAQTIHEQIMANMKTNLQKVGSKEITKLWTELTAQIMYLSTTLTKDFNSQIAKALQTINALNQHFNNVMECLPTNPMILPAHKKAKGLDITN